MKCSLCGFDFDKTSLVCHMRCPLADGCAIICCPNCGYQDVDESKSGAANLIRKVVVLLSKRPDSSGRASLDKEGK